MPGTEDSAFWQEHLAGHTVTRLPRWADGLGGGVGELVLPVPAAAVALATELAVPLPSVVLAALVRVVSLLAVEPDVTIGYRNGDGPAVPLRVRLGGGSWRELAGTVHRAEQAVAAHHRHPPASTDPLFEVGFGVDVPGLALAAQCDGEQVRLRFDAGILAPAYAERIGGYLTRALAALAAGPDQPYRRTDLLSPAERRHLVYERDGLTRALPTTRFHELFAEQARQRPDAVAVVHDGQAWSYRRLDATANQIAHALLGAGLGAEDVVAVATERHPYWLAAIIGVLRAGGAYLPVEPAFPAARVRTLLSQSGCRFALTEPDGLPALADLSDVWSEPVERLLQAGQPSTDPGVPVAPGQLAYVYFTSGSTGLPKGAMCEHLGMINHLTAKIADFEMGPADVVVQNAQQSFDISLWQLIAPLMVGGRTLIVPRDDILDPRRFLDTVVAGGATVLQVVPSYLDVLLRHVEQQPRDLGRLRYVCVTGEAITKPLVNRWFAQYPQIKLVNAYGATEASDDTTHEIMSASPTEELVPVGRPVNNVTVYVLGPEDTLQPLGVSGEIAFSGVCVGRGYVNDPARTAEAFVDDPFRPGRRMYRTGDFGRWLPTGSLEFHGRRDEQVKINGIRIELGEVESRVLEHPRVHAASVVATPLPGAGKSLVAFYTSGDDLPPDELRDHLGRVLPATAVPARLHLLDALPLTANGKVDKRDLIARAQRYAPAPALRVEPGTPTQQRIARAWAQALNRSPDEIGRDDNFFDLGGGSLSALRVVAGLDGLITLDDLVRHPVLSALAAAADGTLHEGTGHAGTGGLLRLLAGPAEGATCAMVCLPYAAGTAINFQPFAAALTAQDATLAVYAAQPPGHDLGRPDEPLLELDQLAKLVADEAAGLGVPLALWGHCSGAALALEVAHRLSGGPPGAIVDRPAPDGPAGTAGRDPAVRHLFLAARRAESPPDLAREIATVIATADVDLATALVEQGGLDGLAEAELTPADLAFIGRAYRHDTRGADQYLMDAAGSAQPARLSCPVTVVVSTSDPGTDGYRAGHGWHRFAVDVALAEVDGGGHYFHRTRPERAAEVVLRSLGRRP